MRKTANRRRTPRKAKASTATRRRSRFLDGVKDIDVEEDGRKIKIHDDPNKGITVEITEKKDEILASLEPGTTEVMCHPGMADEELRAGSTYTDLR